MRNLYEVDGDEEISELKNLKNAFYCSEKRVSLSLLSPSNLVRKSMHIFAGILWRKKFRWNGCCLRLRLTGAIGNVASLCVQKRIKFPDSHKMNVARVFGVFGSAVFCNRGASLTSYFNNVRIYTVTDFPVFSERRRCENEIVFVLL